MDLSVIIPAYNEEMFIMECCESVRLALKDSKLIYEILVVDNGSDDNTARILENITYVRFLKIERSSISNARNYGAKMSTGGLLAFIDADVVVSDKWGRAIEDIFESCKGAVVTGFQYLVRPNGTWIERHWFSRISSSHINGGNLVVSRSAFDQLEGFNKELKTGEDVDFCDRAKFSKEIAYGPRRDLEAIHLGYPRTIGHFMRRELWHGEGDFASLSFFLRSKVALIATVYALAQLIFLVLLGFGYFWLAFMLATAFLMANFVITIVRFSMIPLKSAIVNSVLNYFYFMARFGSLFKAIAKRSRSY
ncbi:glycosyltransferase [Marinobacter sp. M5B]|uniref:glycosyltransferase n=1 Tax=Marinobacter sp. M5B TaxID=3141535 RepID=UPI0036D4378A